ncbi:MAG: tRNA (N6-isopentenyl adenosine(37)-C2)-methylthiotransferase MiaB [Bacteroidetes bacterium]|nr:tRNA (N6-isopentenyl adenosine(37)-C2)-methylthiotransferase MiaB [Bacteroidota bacterium]
MHDIVENPTLSKALYVETYGCQMNIADSEIISGLLNQKGYKLSEKPDNADVIILNTCSVRDNAEKKIHDRLNHLKFYKKKNPAVVIGIVGCMAERLRSELIEKNNIVDLVVGPDEYRKLPELINDAENGTTGIAVRLSRVETYDDITPLRTNGINAWISIMRGCDKFCTFCVVPFTRGRERSRSFKSIVEEVHQLSATGFKEITLIGQNVNSYLDGENDFADLMCEVSLVDQNLRIRFTTSHPQDMSDKLIETIATHKNICNNIHLPVQSGSNRILKLMNRSYSIEHYQNLIEKIKKQIPEVGLSTDLIVGFPTETDEDHKLTLDFLNNVKYDGAYMFKYSPRENTKAWEMGDSVPEEIKQARLSEIIDLQNNIATEINKTLIGKTFNVLTEKESSKSSSDWTGRTDTNKIVVFKKGNINRGDYINVVIEKSNSATLFGKIVE